MKRISTYGDPNLRVTDLSASPDFPVFGDNAIFQNRFMDADNRKLAINLRTWLTSH